LQEEGNMENRFAALGLDNDDGNEEPDAGDS
jgi:hypothetical protein